MSRVFISYRHIGGDQQFARMLADQLLTRGHEPFIDLKMHVGTRWVQEIEAQIRAAEFFVVILSLDSILSDMLRREVELAHELARDRKITILPVRLEYEGDLPFDLGAYLNAFHYAAVAKGQDFAPVVEQIIGAIDHFRTLPVTPAPAGATGLRDEIPALAHLTSKLGAPLPAADLRVETGALRLGSPFYVRRAADAILESELQHPGVTIVAKGPKQSGKSSLLARTSAFARSRQRRVCYIDFQLLARPQLSSLRDLLKCIGWTVAQSLKTQMKPDPWDDNSGDKWMLTTFLENAVLSGTENVALVFDEVDRVFDYDYRDDFFGLIRAWHNRRATHETVWGRCDLILSHSTDPTRWIQDVNESPFNVGERVFLEDFNEEQISDLASRHGLALNRSDVQSLLRLTGGQPYLARQALYMLVKTRCRVSELDVHATDESGLFGDHLRQYAWQLRNSPKLRAAIAQVLESGACSGEIEFEKLKAAGLVRGQSPRSATMRCQLYERYFRKYCELTPTRGS